MSTLDNVLVLDVKHPPTELTRCMIGVFLELLFTKQSTNSWHCVLELKRIKTENPNLKIQLEEDVSLIFFNELGGNGNLNNVEMSSKLKTFSDSVNRKFESLGPWTKDHQLMLNSFLQERFLMANVIKSANAEIEKTKTSGIKSVESLRLLESQNEAYRGLFSKLKQSSAGIGNIEVNSILGAIFTEFDKVSTGNEHYIKELGSLAISDARVNSLIREKDAELSRLRDEIFRLNKLKSTINNSDAHTRTVQVLNE